MIIDGLDICQTYSRSRNFSAQGIRIAYEHFKRLGYEDSDIIIIMKPIRKDKLSEEDQSLISHYHKIQVLHWTPSRKAGKELIASDDDLFILENAFTHDGIVLTNDQYKNHYRKYPKYQHIIKNRLINPTFTKNHLILPIDPMGENGPLLEDFLRF